MANPGLGYRTACDVLVEMSYHLVEQVVNTILQTVLSQERLPNGGFTLVVALRDSRWLYVGASVIIGFGNSNAEVAAVTSLNDDGSVAFAAAQAHIVGEVVLGATFPSQQATDPLFTQDEMLGYLSRAQNEMLAMCPVSYALVDTELVPNQNFQPTPPQTIELNRVAVASYAADLISLSRSAGVVTAQAKGPHNLGAGSTLTVLSDDATFAGSVQVATVPGPNVLTFPQAGADATVLGGTLAYLSRLYETTQAELNMTDRTWRGDSTAAPTAFYQDRTGLYRWGVNTAPASALPAELLISQRDVDSLGMLDGFLVPDMLLHLVKYRALGYVLSKDGAESDPSRAEYCNQRFQRGLAAVNRYLVGYSLGPKGAA